MPRGTNSNIARKSGVGSAHLLGNGGRLLSSGHGIHENTGHDDDGGDD